jgi:hypothetical protein
LQLDLCNHPIVLKHPAAAAADADEERNGMFKLIPHCAKGSWVVSQSVGTTPVILGRKLATSYHTNDRCG